MISLDHTHVCIYRGSCLAPSLKHWLARPLVGHFLLLLPPSPLSSSLSTSLLSLHDEPRPAHSYSLARPLLLPRTCELLVSRLGIMIFRKNLYRKSCLKIVLSIMRKSSALSTAAGKAGNPAGFFLHLLSIYVSYLSPPISYPRKKLAAHAPRSLWMRLIDVAFGHCFLRIQAQSHMQPHSSSCLRLDSLSL